MMAGLAEHALIIMAIPFLGAALGTIFWSKPTLFKTWGLLVITATWLGVAVPSWMSDTPTTISLFLIHLILSTGFLTILGQHPNKETPISLCLMLLFTGLGLGYMVSPGPSGSIFLSGILGLLILALIRHRRQGRETSWYALGILAVGIISLLVSVVVPDPIRIMALLLPLAIVWPLLPVQGAFVSSLTCLPGPLPAFLAVLFPGLGFYGITNLLPVIPEGALTLVCVVAIGSALYGSLLALSQDSMDRLLAYAQMALGAILWWYMALTQSVAQGTVPYLAGLSLVICGLLLASQQIRTRFGHLDLHASHGLAHIMPCFSTLFVLLITAAIGFPMFTLFSSFMEMLLRLSSFPVGNLMMILLVWLMASWYFPRLMQQVLFGHPSPRYQAGDDLRVSEQLSLVLLLALLVTLTIMPSHWFGSTDPAVQTVQPSFGILQGGIWKP